jgi:hypothetical protein
LYWVIIPLTGWQNSDMDKGQGSETVKVGDVMVGDMELTVGLTEETEGENVVTVGEGVVTVGLTLRTI